MKKICVIFISVIAALTFLVGGCAVPGSEGTTPTPSDSAATAASGTSSSVSGTTSGNEETPLLKNINTGVNLPQGSGVLDIFVTDPPPPKMDKILVSIKSVEVHRPGGDWITVAEEPGSFDLKAIEEVQQYLASQIIDAGEYTQIRLEINSVNITVGENEYRATVPSGKIKLVGNFDILEGNSTEITLDFNGEKSVTVTGNGKYIFKPVIKLLAERPSPLPDQTTSEPTVSDVDPDTGEQGETLTAVVISGTNLTGATSVSFGGNITINSFTVDSDSQVTANITIASDAVVGYRDVSVTTPEGTGSLSNAFTVTTT